MLKTLNIVPRAFIFLLDMICVVFALWWAIMVRFNFDNDLINLYIASRTFVLVSLIFGLVFLSIKNYAGIVRYTSSKDAIRVAISVITSSLILALIGRLAIPAVSNLYLQFSILVLLSTFSYFFLMIYRFGVKYIFSYLRNVRMKKKNVIIYGAAEAGMVTKHVLDNDGNNHINVVAFIDDNVKKYNKVLDGITIYPYSQLPHLISENVIDEIVIASFSIPSFRKNELVDFSLNNNIKVLTVPVFKNWNE